ncbi:T-complex protein 11-like protein 1 [Ananas comosus]|uniref:T-complex protein 11-like protein 1 n=1 Tax=Ananas comosus TaxID=4615 RepID=A0A199UGD7_ANACO|nr:T-complex protein 11-like protein 1 [Ananas comosus]
MDPGGGVDFPAAVAMDFPAEAPSSSSSAAEPAKVPRRLRRRLLAARSGSASSVGEIEAKLREADLRRQERKRLARLDELRVAAKIGIKTRFEEERKELDARVESRARQAEANRLRLLNAYMQRRAALKERTARCLIERLVRENKYKECVYSAILQKRAAAEKKRMGLLEAEKRRAQARVIQARCIAKFIFNKRELERRKMKQELENRLQRAKRQRAEYLRLKGSPHSCAHSNWISHGDLLARKLASCWRKFVTSKGTTFTLTRAYEDLGINENSVKSIPFEQLALLIESPIVLQTTKALLDRLESRFLLSQSSNLSTPENIDHLLKHLTSSPNKRVPAGKAKARGITEKTARSSKENKLLRYPMRAVLCAYMILGHPNAVFSEHGKRESLLIESAINFVQEFGLLVTIILDGPNSGHQKTFRSQLAAFDAAWRAYLYRFVIWKVKDAKSLEKDLVRAACELELSMMRACKLTSEGKECDISHDMNAMQTQVIEGQKLPREKVQHLSGNAGIEQIEFSLSNTRSECFEVNSSVPEEHSSANIEKFSIVRSLFGSASSPQNSSTDTEVVDMQSNQTIGKRSPAENELLVNEIVHGNDDASPDNLDVGGTDEIIKAKVKETMEKAFWDGVVDSMKGDKPDYSRILGLVKEVRDELCDLAPQSWREEITNSIDLDILSQILESGFEDPYYLRKVLEYSLAMLQKLSAPANEVEMRKAHEKLLSELVEISLSNDGKQSMCIVSMIKGLQFILEEIQELKREVSKARIQLLEPIIKGSAGLEYLQTAFAERYGPPSDAAISLPLTVQWISSLKNTVEEEWDEHLESLSALLTDQGQPLVTTLRTGGRISRKEALPHVNTPGNNELPECDGEKVDLMVRLGLLKLASGVEGVTMQSVPETFKLNASRLRSIQSRYQQIIIITTSILVLRQILISESAIIPATDLERLISEFVQKLRVLLLSNAANAGVEEIAGTMASCLNDLFPEAKLQSTKEVMARMLIKSLQSGDAVFEKVSRSVYLAVRAVVLRGGGGDGDGQKLADAALRRVGAGMLTDQVAKAAEILVKMATISGWVHGPWYRSLL